LAGRLLPKNTLITARFATGSLGCSGSSTRRSCPGAPLAYTGLP